MQFNFLHYLIALKLFIFGYASGIMCCGNLVVGFIVVIEKLKTVSLLIRSAACSIFTVPAQLGSLHGLGLATRLRLEIVE